MLTPGATMQIHFIDIIAIGDVESGALLVEQQPCNAVVMDIRAVVMDIRDVTARRNDQP
jgi:hypothetical protein